MISQFFIARSGMSSYQKMMINITNNIANAQTPGFKQSRVELENLFPMIMAEAEAALENAEEVEPALRKRRGMDIGTGVRIVAVLRDFRQGTQEITQKPLDVSIEGEGFFQFRLEDGRVAYSRAGNLRKDSFGNLIDQNGHLLDPPIQIPQEIPEANITIASDGRVLVHSGNELQQREVGQMLVARFINPQGLKPIGKNLYVPTPESDDPIVDVPGQNATGTITQYALENSNVDIIDQMTRMMIVQKGFELLANAARAGEKMLKSASDVTSV